MLAVRDSIFVVNLFPKLFLNIFWSIKTPSYNPNPTYLNENETILLKYITGSLYE